jgi:hypothetical protein
LGTTEHLLIREVPPQPVPRHRRALDFLQALEGDEFRAARPSHTFETTGDVLCVAESAMSAASGDLKEEKCPSP